MKAGPKAKMTVSAYIAAAPAAARPMLRQLRAAVRAAAPGADERISYRMPSYAYRGRLVYFAAFKDHVSLYVWGPVLKRFAARIEPYHQQGATLHFPLGTRIPAGLVKELVTARRKENEALARKRKIR